MKINTHNVSRVMADIGAWKGVLFYGDDVGLIRERAITSVKQIVESLDDPFRLARLEGEEEHQRLEEEALALSLVGGRRAVWVRDAQDALVPLLERTVQHNNDTLLVLEAGKLSPRSTLRMFAEKHPQFAVIACYPEEGQALSRSISEFLAEDNVRVNREGMTWLLSHLGHDRTLVRSELEKLRLYGGEGARLALEDVQHCVGDTAEGSLEDAIYAALRGHRLAADQAFERALADGTHCIAFIRATLTVLERLLQVCFAIEAGHSRSDAMAELRPPVFFRRKEAFQHVLERWSRANLLKAAEATHMLEWACKQRAAPDILLCRRHLVKLCHPRMESSYSLAGNPVL